MQHDKRTDLIRYAECGRQVTEAEAEREGWGYWSAGSVDCTPNCPECAWRESAPGRRSRLREDRERLPIYADHMRCGRAGRAQLIWTVYVDPPEALRCMSR